MESLSDGVFAFAVTLLDLTIAQPNNHSKMARQLLDRWPSLATYVVTLLIIGITGSSDFSGVSWSDRVRARDSYLARNGTFGRAESVKVRRRCGIGGA